MTGLATSNRNAINRSGGNVASPISVAGKTVPHNTLGRPRFRISLYVDICPYSTFVPGVVFRVVVAKPRRGVVLRVVESPAYPSS